MCTNIVKIQRNVTECKSSGLIYGPRMSELPNLNMSELIHLNLLTQAFFSQLYQPWFIIRILGHAAKKSFQPLQHNNFWKKRCNKEWKTTQSKS